VRFVLQSSGAQKRFDRLYIRFLEKRFQLCSALNWEFLGTAITTGQVPSICHILIYITELPDPNFSREAELY
jgi:hypothetical protein